MIRVAVVDDHPAVRLGLEGALRTEPGLIPIGSATGPEELAPLLYRTHPDVVLVDYHLPRRDGLILCQQVKADVPSPALLLYSAYADAALVVPAIVAGADGIVHKNAPPRELFEAIRMVARGRSAFPPLSTALLQAAGEALEPDDLPILGMLIHRTPRLEIARTLRVTPDALTQRIAAMLTRLKTPIGTA